MPDLAQTLATAKPDDGVMLIIADATGSVTHTANVSAVQLGLPRAPSCRSPRTCSMTARTSMMPQPSCSTRLKTPSWNSRTRTPMPDAVDAAAEITDQWNARGITAARRALAGTGSLFCEDCETEIPARRRALQPNATRCVPCLGRLETRHAR